MQYVLTLIVLVNIIFVTGEHCDETKCKNYKFEEHYRDLNCEPIFGDGGCCPTRYECPAITQMSEHRDKCHFHGKVLEQGASLKEIDGTSCNNAACFCNRIEDQPARFICASRLCQNPLLHSEMFCREKNTIDQCCPKQICGEDPTTLKNCTLDGHSYISGQRMYPVSDRCQQCICEDDGTKTCKKISCDLQLRRVNDLINFCAPVYYGDSCCPTEFICPGELIVIDRKKNSNTDSKKMCKFGTDLVQINDEITYRGRYCLRCKCVTPPFVTCSVDAKCRG